MSVTAAGLHRWAWLAVVLALAIAAGCSGDDKGGGTAAKPQFDPADADRIAHAAVLRPEDLPVGSWEVTAEDEPDEDDPLVDEVFKREPSCSHISALEQLGGPFGDDDDKPSGSASVELARVGSRALLPATVQHEVEIAQTVSDAEGGWQLVKELFGQAATKTCFNRLFQAAIAEGLGQGGQVTVTTVAPSATAPRNGTSLAYEFAMRVAGLSFSGIFELYMWPQSNAAATLFVIGTREELSAGTVREIVAAADRKLGAAK